MKNWVPPLPGCPGTRTADTVPPGVLFVAELLLDEAQPTAAKDIYTSRILGKRVASLNDPVPHHSVKDCAVVRTIQRQRDEQSDVIWSVLGKQVDDDCAEVRLENPLPAGHLFD